MDAASSNLAGHAEQAAPENNNSNAMDIEAPAFSEIPGLGSVSAQTSAPSPAAGQDGKHTFTRNSKALLLTFRQPRQLQTQHQFRWTH